MLEEIFVKLSRYFESLYSNVDKCMKDVFERYPDNKNIVGVLEKVGIVGSLYGPFVNFDNRTGFREMAIHVQKNANLLDLLVESENESELLEAFEMIRAVNGKKNNTGEWAFASKYLHFSRPEFFAIYDSNAEKTVSWLRRLGKIHSLPHHSNFSYKNWVDAVGECKDLAGGELTTIKQIDEALYGLGALLADNDSRTVREVHKAVMEWLAQQKVKQSV